METRNDWLWALLLAGVVTLFGSGCLDFLGSEHFKSWYYHPLIGSDGGYASAVRSAVTSYQLAVSALYAATGMVLGVGAIRGQVRAYVQGLAAIVGLMLVVIFTSGLGQEESSEAINDLPLFSTLLYFMVVLLPIGLLLRAWRGGRVERSNGTSRHQIEML